MRRHDRRHAGKNRGGGGRLPAELAAPATITLNAPSNPTNTSIDISWTAPDPGSSAITKYEIYVTGNPGENYTVTATAGATSKTITGLSSGRSYDFYIIAENLNGLRSIQSEPVSEYTTSTDTEAPTAPVVASPADVITETSVIFSWSASTDNVGVAEYRIFQDGVQVGTVSSATLEYEATGLTNSTAYAFTVKAADLAGNISDASNTLNATTATPADTEAPTAPVLASPHTNITETSMDLLWSHATDNVAVDVYDIHKDGVYLDWVLHDDTSASGSNRYSVNGLTAGTEYTFTVYAIDAARNVSPASNAVAGTTAQPPTFQRAYGDSAAWNLLATGFPTHASSASYVSMLSGSSMAWGLSGFSLNDWSMAIYYVADANDTYTLRTTDVWSSWKDKTLAWHADWTAPNNSGDRHIVLLDESNGREWSLYNVYNIDHANKLVYCDYGNIVETTIDFHSGASPADYRTKVNGFKAGGRGCGIQGLALIPRPEEVEQGVIEHALGMPLMNAVCSPSYYNPATKSDGPTAGKIPEGTRFRGTWTDADIATWLATINSRVLGAGGSQATSDGLQLLARTVAVALRDYGWFISDKSGSNHFQLEQANSANLSRGRTRWSDLNIPNNTTYGSKVYPRQLLDGLITSSNFIAVDGVASYPPNTD